MGLKLAATKHQGTWQVDTRSGNLFDMIDKVIALDGAGALPTEFKPLRHHSPACSKRCLRKS